jgi:hypothetical protein
MKSNYHKMDVLTWDQALGTLTIKEYINVVNTEEDAFKEYGTILDKFYGSFKPGTIKKPHLSSGRHECISVNAV